MGRYTIDYSATKPTTDVTVDSLLDEIDTEDRYRFNKYGRWELISHYRHQSKRIPSIFVPKLDAAAVIYGEPIWKDVNIELHNSGNMIYLTRTSATNTNETSYIQLNDFANVDMKPKLIVPLKFGDTGSNSAVFCGLIKDSDTTLDITSYLTGTTSCIGFGYRKTDTNFFVFHKTTAGTLQAVDTGIARNTNIYQLYIHFESSTSVRIILFNGSDMTIAFEATYTTDIPLSGIDLASALLIVNDNISTRYGIYMYEYMYLEKDRPAWSATVDF